MTFLKQLLKVAVGF